MKRQLLSLVVLLLASLAHADGPTKGRFLYVAEPGVRDYQKWGGLGILVFDIDNGHKLVKRIPGPHAKDKSINVKGICASTVTKKLYMTTPVKLYCIDLKTEKLDWVKELPLGCDRMSMTPDGKVLYVPSYEKETWNVVDARTGDIIETITTKSGAHNTVVALDGRRMYMAGLRSPFLDVADTKTHKVTQRIGPFSAPIRPFTVNGAQTLAYCTVNGLLGFEIGDIKSGKVIHKVEIQGFKQGKVDRHGCPSHGVGLTPDEKEVWVVDAANRRVHIFDNTVMPPKQVMSIELREQPGWITFSVDGKFAYPSTGEVIDTKTRKIILGLMDEEGREVQSEKVMEIDFEDGVPVLVGDQFGVGRKR
ncbi:MAG: hypothetical protein U0793_21040 [Gemmataceae bacterium]